MPKRHTLAALPIALSILLATAAQAQAVGDWVLAPWRDTKVYYPGTVEARNGQSVTVRFDDGTSDTRTVDEVLQFDWARGSQIACRWTDGNWYDATITRMDGNGYNLQIRYDLDGVIEETNTGRCRSR